MSIFEIDIDEPNRVLFAIVASIAFLLAIDYFLRRVQNQDEPPEVAAAIPVPLLGHTIGLMRHKMGYYVKLSRRYQLPIYSISTFGGRIYVVNSPEVATAVFRNTKDLSFAQMAAEVVSRVSLSSDKGTRTMLENANGRQGDKGYTPEGFKLIHAALAPGPGLHDMVSAANAKVAATLDQLVPESSAGEKPVMLYASMQHVIVQATSEAVYGPLSPFRHPAVEKAFWDFEKGFTALLVNVAPGWTASRGHRGRQLVQNEFEGYFQAGGHLQASNLTRVRYDVAERHGLSVRDMARFETTMAIGTFGTTAPSTFWMAFFLFSRPALLAKLRAEMDAATTTTEGPAPHRTLDVAAIRSSELVSALWNEVLRRSACGTSARLVEQDCVLPTRGLHDGPGGGGSIRLRKGAVVQMPSRVLHTDQRLWGESVDQFDPGRFYTAGGNNNSNSGPKGKKTATRAGAFRPFGGGNTLCPGRHFAQAEITAMAVMMACRFDIEPATVSGEWEEPEMYATSVAAAIYSPRKDVAVRIKKRRGFELGTWAFANAD